MSEYLLWVCLFILKDINFKQIGHRVTQNMNVFLKYYFFELKYIFLPDFNYYF